MLTDAREVAHGDHAEAGQALLGGGPDSGEALDRKGVEEIELRAGLDDEEAVGLGEVTRQLGQQLRDGDTDRRGEPGLLAHAPADRRRALRPGAVRPRATRNVEELFVKGAGLDERHTLSQHDVYASV